jgi:hypothetical protein
MTLSGAGHQYRRSCRAFAPASATVLDPSGTPLPPQQEIWGGVPA